MGKSCAGSGLCFLLNGGSQLVFVCERLEFVCLNVSSDLPRASHNHLSWTFAQFNLCRLPRRPPNDSLHLHECLYLLPLCYGIVDKAAKIAQILVLRHPLLFRSLVQHKSEDLGWSRCCSDCRCVALLSTSPERCTTFCYDLFGETPGWNTGTVL